MDRLGCTVPTHPPILMITGANLSPLCVLMGSATSTLVRHSTTARMYRFSLLVDSSGPTMSIANLSFGKHVSMNCSESVAMGWQSFDGDAGDAASAQSKHMQGERRPPVSFA